MSIQSPSDKTTRKDIKDASLETAESVKNEATKLGNSALASGEAIAREQAEKARDQVAARSDSVETAAHEIASTLGEHSDTLGQYASEFAGTLSSLNDRLKTSSIDDLASDARRIARENPAMFMLGAVTIGAIAARFFQASAPNQYQSQITGNNAGSTTASPNRPYTGGTVSTTQTTKEYSV